MIITSLLWQQYNNDKVCPYFNKQYRLNGDMSFPCFDHYHIGGIYQKTMVICKACNILIRKSADVAVSHGLQGSDGALIFKSLKLKWLQKIDLFAKDAETIISMTLPDMCRFIDCKQFFDMTFENLVDKFRFED